VFWGVWIEDFPFSFFLLLSSVTVPCIRGVEQCEEITIKIMKSGGFCLNFHNRDDKLLSISDQFKAKKEE
jgi:hypothetical protein